MGNGTEDEGSGKAGGSVGGGRTDSPVDSGALCTSSCFVVPNSHFVSLSVRSITLAAVSARTTTSSVDTVASSAAFSGTSPWTNTDVVRPFECVRVRERNRAGPGSPGATPIEKTVKFFDSLAPISP